MTKDLQDSYTLNDLMTEVAKLFASQELRQVNFVFYDGLTYILECMDAKSLRLRYIHVVDGKREVLAYSEISKQDLLLHEVDKDIRSCMRANSVINDRARLEIYMSGETKPAIYKIRPGGFAYIRRE